MRSAWDIVGLASLLVFGGSLYAINEGTEAARLATPVELGTATELQAGDEWLGLYFGEQKVGLTHIHKERREAGGWEYEYRTSLKLDVAGTGLSIDLEVHVDLSDLLAVESFTFALETGAQKFRGEGKVTDRRPSAEPRGRACRAETRVAGAACPQGEPRSAPQPATPAEG